MGTGMGTAMGMLRRWFRACSGFGPIGQDERRRHSFASAVVLIGLLRKSGNILEPVMHFECRWL